MRRPGVVVGQQRDPGRAFGQAGVAFGRAGGLQVPARGFVELAGLQGEFAGERGRDRVVAGGSRRSATGTADDSDDQGRKQQ